MIAKRIAMVALLLAAACAESNDAKKSDESPAKTERPAAPEPAPEPEPKPELLAEGTPAPDFSVQDHRGETISLSALKGRPVVLYWYPKDETPG